MLIRVVIDRTKWYKSRTATFKNIKNGKNKEKQPNKTREDL